MEPKRTNEGREVDDGRRASQGVVACIVATGDGRVRLVLDDVVAESPNASRIWRAASLYTWSEYDREEFLRSEIGESEFARLGFALAVRLAAIARLEEEFRSEGSEES